MKFNKSIWLIIPVAIIFAGTLFFVRFLFNDKNISPGDGSAYSEGNENCGAKRGNCGKSGNASVKGSVAVNLKVPETCIAGNPGAEVTIIEFSDFLCPYCKTASELLKTVLKSYEGRIKLVFVNYPLDMKCNVNVKTKMHQGACLLAKGAVCSARQNRFSEYMEAAFALNGKSADIQEVRQLAILSHVDLPLFMDCMKGPETEIEIKNQIESLHRLNINSVPVIFINGRQIPNWSDKAAMMRIIDDELYRKK